MIAFEEEIKRMTRVQINAAIARLQGWKPKRDEYRSTEKYETMTSPPDYAGSYELMHEVEKSLGHGLHVTTYTKLLEQLVRRSGGHPLEAAGQVWFATPILRAEAYLRTMGEWPMKVTC